MLSKPRKAKVDRAVVLPTARSEGLIVEQLGDELLVYDLETVHGHCLSATAARVWERCDGKTTVDALRGELGVDRETLERALAELAGCELLERPPGLERASTRRELTARVVKLGAAVASVPMIISVAAPTPAMAVTLNFCKQFTSGNCGTSDPSEGCKRNGCCCCTPPVGPGPIKACVDVFANCPPNANSCP